LSPQETADSMRQMLFSFLEGDCIMIPVGTILEYAGVLLPDGFLWADGSQVSRAVYSDLFGVVGLIFGVGDGSTTFNLPDKRGRVGVGQNLEIVPELERGDSGGEYVHTLTVAEMPAHNHDILAAAAAGGTTGRYAPGGATGTNNTTIIANKGGGAAHNNMPPYVVLNYIIKF